MSTCHHCKFYDFSFEKGYAFRTCNFKGMEGAHPFAKLELFEDKSREGNQSYLLLGEDVPESNGSYYLLGGKRSQVEYDRPEYELNALVDDVFGRYQPERWVSYDSMESDAVQRLIANQISSGVATNTGDVAREVYLLHLAGIVTDNCSCGELKAASDPSCPYCSHSEVDREYLEYLEREADHHLGLAASMETSGKKTLYSEDEYTYMGSTLDALSGGIAWKSTCDYGVNDRTGIPYYQPASKAAVSIEMVMKALWLRDSFGSYKPVGTCHCGAPIRRGYACDYCKSEFLDTNAMTKFKDEALSVFRSMVDSRSIYDVIVVLGKAARATGSADLEQLRAVVSYLKNQRVEMGNRYSFKEAALKHAQVKSARKAQRAVEDFMYEVQAAKYLDTDPATHIGGDCL